MPHNHLPKISAEFMVVEVAKKLKCFPVKHGSSKYHSPRIILRKKISILRFIADL